MWNWVCEEQMLKYEGVEEKTQGGMMGRKEREQP